MSTGFAEAIHEYVQNKGINEDLVLQTIEASLLAAYKKRYGTTENAVCHIDEENMTVNIYSKKEIVQEVDDDLFEISLDEALKYNEDSEIGDEILIEISPEDFGRIAIQAAKQVVKQRLRDIETNQNFAEYKEKEGELIVGYYQRERNGNIYVDLGNTEGILLKKFQSPIEEYHQNDRIKCLIQEVKKARNNVQIILSRTHPEFVKKLLELEVPELQENLVEIYDIVREPGYRSKIAVYSYREDIDPVGACVGLRGVRIQTIVKELEGEKIDVFHYTEDIKAFIKNALSPAEVLKVIVIDDEEKTAIAVVPENQFSIALGKRAMNLRLAKKLTNWEIDIKTEAQLREMGFVEEHVKEAEELFSDVDEEEVLIEELPGITPEIVAILAKENINTIEELIELNKSDLLKINGLETDQVNTILKSIEDNLEIITYDEEEGKESSEEESAETAETMDQDVAVEEKPDQDRETVQEDEQVPETASEEAGISPEPEVYECPECGADVTEDMKNCPNCGVGISFEDE